MGHLIPLSTFPVINAVLNGICTILLVTGYVLIKQHKMKLHKTCMIAAFACSALFLVFYLTFHALAGVIRFGGQGWIRPVYFTLLLTHTTLAVIIVPLVLITLTRAFKKRFDPHRRIARWTLPIWLYVSVTGVVVYWLLYVAYTPIWPA
jgi:putative membrane protein